MLKSSWGWAWLYWCQQILCPNPLTKKRDSVLQTCYNYIYPTVSVIVRRCSRLSRLFNSSLYYAELAQPVKERQLRITDIFQFSSVYLNKPYVPEVMINTTRLDWREAEHDWHLLQIGQDHPVPHCVDGHQAEVQCMRGAWYMRLLNCVRKILRRHAADWCAAGQVCVGQPCQTHRQ